MLRILFSRLGKPFVGPPGAYAFNVPSVRASGAITVERGAGTVDDRSRGGRITGFHGDGQHRAAGAEVGLDEVFAVEADHRVEHLGATGGLLHLGGDVVGRVIDCLAE